jgi:hypothetical protein
MEARTGLSGSISGKASDTRAEMVTRHMEASQVTGISLSLTTSLHEKTIYSKAVVR